MGIVGVWFCFFASLQADPPTSTPTPSLKPTPASSVPAPTPLPDTFNRYGKILSPNDEPSHPLKLNMPFPDAGEVKIPSQDELTERTKLEELAALSDADILAQLEQWPAFGKMKLADEGTMLVRIQQFKDRRTRLALEKAHLMGLLTLTPDQQARFEKEYWEKRLQMDRDLAKQFQPILKNREQKLQEELFREFSSPVQPGTVATGAKPPAALSTQPKPTPSPAPPTQASTR
jgi:hypothetical protein